METNRDDFAIAFRSALLSKGVRQKFSLFVLIVISIVFLTLDNINNKQINLVKSVIKDGIYRVSFVASYPSDIVFKTSVFFKNHFNVYNKNKELKIELDKYKNLDLEKTYLKTENKQLKDVLNESTSTDFNSLTSKVLLDKDSPYLHSIVINQGTKSGIKKGMPALDHGNLVGRVTEVNFISARILLLSDLNSRIPVVTEPLGYQAILSGSGRDKPYLEYLPKNHQLENGNVVYTSGKDGIFLPGIPIGKAKLSDEKTEVELFSDFNQLTFVNIILTESTKEEE